MLSSPFHIFQSFLFCSLLILVATSCGNNSSGSDCAIGAPQAMFGNSLNGIEKYNFSVTGQESSETFMFHGTPINITQSGCDLIQQVFQFEVAKGKDSEVLIADVVHYLVQFAQLGQQQSAFLAWSQAIDELKPEIKISQPFSPARGIQITIDRIQQVDTDLLLLKLEMSQI